MKINRNRGDKAVKRIGVSVAVLVFLVACYSLFAWTNRWFPFVSYGDDTYEPGTQFVNMNKTDSERKAAEDIKNDPEKKLENSQVDRPSAPSEDTLTGKQSVNILITSVGISNGTVSARGFVTNITETGGRCEYVFVKGTEKIIKPVDTLPNATSTTCKTITFPASELSSGKWLVTLSYLSNTAEGSSSVKDFTK